MAGFEPARPWRRRPAHRASQGHTRAGTGEVTAGPRWVEPGQGPGPGYDPGSVQAHHVRLVWPRRLGTEPRRAAVGRIGGRRDMSKVHFALALSLATGAVAALSGAAAASSGAAAPTPVLATHPLAIPGPGLAEAGAVRRLAQATAAPTTSAGSATPPASAATRSGPTTSGGRRQMSGSSAVERAAGSGNGRASCRERV